MERLHKSKNNVIVILFLVPYPDYNPYKLTGTVANNSVWQRSCDTNSLILRPSVYSLLHSIRLLKKETARE